MSNTLKYLLDCASYLSPHISADIFTQWEDVNFEFLLQNRYLVENGSLAASVRRFGVPVPVYLNHETHEHYLFDQGEPEIVPWKELLMYDICYDPLASLLSETYCGESDAEAIIPNSLWNLGIPLGGNSNVYLARNADSDAKVYVQLSSLYSCDTVLWFGREPERPCGECTCFPLSGYLRWSGGRIEVRDQWPASLCAAAGVRGYKDALIHTGDVWEIWYNGQGPAKISADLIGMTYIVRIIQAGEGGKSCRDIVLPAAVSDAACADPKELAYSFNGTDGDMPAYTEEEIQRIRKLLKDVRQGITVAKKNNDTAETERLQKVLDSATEHLNKSTRPGGKAIMATSQFKNITRGIASAVDTVCKRLAKQDRKDIAEHFKRCIETRQTCRYTDSSRQWKIQT